MTFRVIFIGFFTFLTFSTHSLASTNGPHKKFECNLWEDPQGISHIQANTDAAAYACLGYIHSRDRAWQMDFLRRTVQGRKAEVFGSKEIRSDYFMRLLNLYERAEMIFKGLTPLQQELLKAYSNGVNQGFSIALQTGVYEFQKWNTRPEPWQPKDSIALILLQSFDQTKKSFLTDYQESKNLSLYGKDALPLLNGDELPWNSSILKKGEYPLGNTAQKIEIKSGNHDSASNEIKNFFEEIPDLLPPTGIGSNNWVIAPSRSQSGHAWLANDPHLELRHPSLWHIAHFQSPSFDVIGAAIPGVPLIVSGANRHLAWGLTNSYLDVADLILIPNEELTTASDERPWIWFKLWKAEIPFFFKKLKRTTGGRPILPLDGPSGKSIVLNWTGFDLTGQDFIGFFELMKASRIQDADLALSRIGVPSWNFVFADKAGGIGYRSIGRVPKKQSASPYGMTEENLAQFNDRVSKQELLSADEMPHVLNPTRGWIATANNRQWPADSKFYPGRAHHQGFRQFRIEELLTLNPKHDLESFRKIQCDVQAVDARFILPELLKSVKTTPETLSATTLLKEWNYQTDLKCKACALYRRWINYIQTNSSLNSVGLYHLLQAPENPLSVSLQKTINESLSQALSDFHLKVPQWGEVHSCLFPHLGDRHLFEDQGIPTPGDDETVNPGNSEWQSPFFHQTSGASLRLVVELSDPPKIYSILPGSIKDLESRDFNNVNSPWNKWVRCQYESRQFPINWSQVKATQLSINSSL